VFLGLPHKGPKLSNFPIHKLIEIKPILFATPNLQQIVIQCLFGDPHLRCRQFQRLLYKSALFIIKACVEPPPECNLLYDLAYPLLLLLGTPILPHLPLPIPPLLLQQIINERPLILPNLQPQLHNYRLYLVVLIDGGGWDIRSLIEFRRIAAIDVYLLLAVLGEEAQVADRAVFPQERLAFE
jgi:hypothetical protein